MFKKVSNHHESLSTSSTIDSTVSQYVVNPSPIPSTTNNKKSQIEIRSKPNLHKYEDEEPIYANHRSTVIDDSQHIFRAIPHRVEPDVNYLQSKPTRRLNTAAVSNKNNRHQISDVDSIGPEISKFSRRSSGQSNNYETTEVEELQQTPPPIPPPPPAFAKPYLYNAQRTTPPSPPLVIFYNSRF